MTSWSEVPFDRRSLAVALAVVCAGIAGCASYGPGPLQAGDAEAAVIARMGVPTERVKRDGGERLVYARGPMGRETWMVDVGAEGRVTRIYQALVPQRMAEVVPGMSEAALLDWLGPPAERRRLGLEGRRLWAWRYPTNECFWFQVTLTSAGNVMDAGYGIDPMCDVRHE